ncbi:unnamed protein product [Triticum turgidum subsp. durum]|uniref:EF-hand domain-containing protein n=1 Tax=Triticum turgidum subsp. durum TaxID=4567 RepID=A0A9R1R4J7_TRITD|nr:unnamed protein product [Triticum turgidum subsp. durum]
MAIRGVPSQREMTVAEFKEWLKQFDADGDGRISRADRDNSGFIDDAEVENLVAFAQKDLGMRISAW